MEEVFNRLELKSTQMQNQEFMLSSMAKAYLTVPPTSVPSKQGFSIAGDIVNAQRSLLLSGNVDMLIFLKKKKRSLSDDK